MGKRDRSKADAKDRQKRKARHERRKAAAASADRMKADLRAVGCDLPFYDSLDSYEAEFERTVAAARADLPTIREIRVLDRLSFDSVTPYTLWSEQSQVIEFDTKSQAPDYAQQSPDRIRFGFTFYVNDGQPPFGSIIVLPESPRPGLLDSQKRFLFLLPILLHEIGHVADAERGGFLDPRVPKFDVIEGEAYAHCFALDRLADRCLGFSYDFLFNFVAGGERKDGFVGAVARRVLELHPRRTIPRVADYLPAVAKYREQKRLK